MRPTASSLDLREAFEHVGLTILGDADPRIPGEDPQGRRIVVRKSRSVDNRALLRLEGRFPNIYIYLSREQAGKRLRVTSFHD